MEQPSYIIGTHHLAPSSIMDSIAGLKKALNETQQVYGEIKMSEMQSPATMKAAPTFVAVGALHLPGEKGLLNLLKKQGYTVEPVK